MRFKVSELVKINKTNLRKNDDISELKYLDTTNLNEGIINKIVKYNVKRDKIPSRAKRKVQKNDILISTVRPNQKHYGFIEEQQEDYIVSTGFAVLSPDTKKVDPYYLYKYLTMDRTTEYFQVIAENSTSAYPSIKPSVIGDLELNIPELGTQRIIGKFSKDIDDKIKLNNSIISNLEELAQTLFKRWFVDFEFPNENGEPYKSSGGKMIKSEFGETPAKWNSVKLKNIFDIKYGKNMPKKKLIEDGYPVYGANGIIGYTNNYLYKESQVIITCRGNGSGDVFKTIPFAFITNNSLVLEDNNSLGVDFTRFTIKRNNPYNYKTGSAQPQITITNIGEMNILLPVSNILKEFEKLIKPLSNKQLKAQYENDKLTELRDTLLPKLLSGEIKLPDHKEVIEDVPVS